MTRTRRPRPCKHRRPAGRGRRGAGLLALALLALALLAAPLLAAGGRRAPGAAVVPVRGEISDIMRDSIRRRVDRALADGATVIIFEMDTPGGLVTSALDICRTIKNLPAEVRTVAWVHNTAYSAGAMISLACNEILMSRRSSIGDCAPIMVTPVGGLEGLPAAERAKAESPILEEFRDSAIRNGYDPLLARAMVSVGVEVWWLEQAATGERRFVTGDEKKVLINDVAAEQRPWRLVESYADQVSGRTEAVRQPIDSAGELLTLRQSEAVAFGLARGIAADPPAVAEQLGLVAAPLYLEITGWEKFVMWLNSPLVRGILFAIVLIGAYIEFQSPGLILPGATAAVALLIFLGAPYLAGLADVWTFIVLGLGLVLLAIEVFVLPGFGIAGILGIALILLAIIGTFVPAEPRPDDAPLFSLPRLQGTWDALRNGLVYLSASVIVAVIGILLILRYLPQLSVGRQLIPANPRADALALADPYAGIALVGEVGIVTGALRPAGQARFGQEVVDVQSQGEYVESGRRVQVIKREGAAVVVRPLPEESTA